MKTDEIWLETNDCKERVYFWSDEPFGAMRVYFWDNRL